MKQYEYKIVSDPKNFTTDKLLSKLNELGKKGWKLVPSFVFSHFGQLLFEREKENKD